MEFEPKVTIKSPGRINLIGEHLDYNGGNVMPAAINLSVTLKFKENDKNLCYIYSKNYKDGFTIDLKNISQSKISWHNYFLGVIHFIEQKRPNKVKGFDCVVESDLPIGSGVSSSAALECGIAKGLNELFALGLNDMDIITISRDAEHHFVGTKCGIMDQFAVVNGKSGHFMKLNCQNLSYTHVAAKLEPYRLLLLNTNVEHALETTEYNKRREECETGLKLINSKGHQFDHVSQIPYALISEYKNEISKPIFNRLKYVIEENHRTSMAGTALFNNDLKALGSCLYASHKGLKSLYEVSCIELDFLVAFSKQYQQVIGSRMMGGGFGGCTISLVHSDFVEEFIRDITKAYYNRFNIHLTSFTVNIGNGVSII